MHTKRNQIKSYKLHRLYCRYCPSRGVCHLSSLLSTSEKDPLMSHYANFKIPRNRWAEASIIGIQFLFFSVKWIRFNSVLNCLYLMIEQNIWISEVCGTNSELCTTSTNFSVTHAQKFNIIQYFPLKCGEQRKGDSITMLEIRGQPHSRAPEHLRSQECLLYPSFLPPVNQEDLSS